MKVDVTFTWEDGLFDIQYTTHESAHTVDEKHVMQISGDFISIDPITSETEQGIIVDFDAPKDTTPISITVENIDIDRIDLDNDAVINFAKYLIDISYKE